MKRVASFLRFFFLALVFFCVETSAQERIDSTFNFESDPAKQFSIYVPSSYDAATPTKLMLGLHPFNVNRWNSISWCDTLIAFAEENNLLLLCPDGGADGKVDDPIDVSFTTFLLEEVQSWYNVDTNKIFATGFSWGGRTTYSYGLANSEVFAGLMPVGAAVNGTQEVNDVLSNAADEPIYVIHGSLDSPNSRYYPILEAIEDNGAIVNSLFMNGIGHTIDFPNRNAILKEAFMWLDSVSTAQIPVDTMTVDPTDTMTTAIYENSLKNFSVYPNPVQKGQKIFIDFPTNENAELFIYDLNGHLIYREYFTENRITLDKEWKEGIYFLMLKDGDRFERTKFLLQN